MRNFFLLLFTFSTYLIFAQVKKIPLDTMVVTNHSIVINGQNLSYQATAGTQPVWNAKGEPTGIASQVFANQDFGYHKVNIERPDRRHAVVPGDRAHRSGAAGHGCTRRLLGVGPGLRDDDRLG